MDDLKSASRAGAGSSAELLKARGSTVVDDEDKYKPQKSSFFVLWFRQYGVMLKNNFTLTVRPTSHTILLGREPQLFLTAAPRCLLTVALPNTQFLRYYRSTILQMIAPFFFMLFLYLLQQAAKSSDVIPNPYPTPYPLGGFYPCKVIPALPRTFAPRLAPPRPASPRPAPPRPWLIRDLLNTLPGERAEHGVHQRHVQPSERHGRDRDYEHPRPPQQRTGRHQLCDRTPARQYGRSWRGGVWVGCVGVVAGYDAGGGGGSAPFLTPPALCFRALFSAHCFNAHSADAPDRPARVRAGAVRGVYLRLHGRAAERHRIR